MSASTEQDLAVVRARLKELGALRDGWLDGRGVAPTRESIRFCGELLGLLVTTWDLPAPHLYPTEEGGIQAEWTFGAWEVEAVFDFAKQVIVAGAVNINTSEEQNTVIRIDDPLADAELANFVLGLADA